MTMYIEINCMTSKPPQSVNLCDILSSRDTCGVHTCKRSVKSTPRGAEISRRIETDVGARAAS